MCKTLVVGRCEEAGMRIWARCKAEAVLRLRAAQWVGDFGPLGDARLRLAAWTRRESSSARQPQVILTVLKRRW